MEHKFFWKKTFLEGKIFSVKQPLSNIQGTSSDNFSLLLKFGQNPDPYI